MFLSHQCFSIYLPFSTTNFLKTPLSFPWPNVIQLLPSLLLPTFPFVYYTDVPASRLFSHCSGLCLAAFFSSFKSQTSNHLLVTFLSNTMHSIHYCFIFFIALKLFETYTCFLPITDSLPYPFSHQCNLHESKQLILVCYIEVLNRYLLNVLIAILLK